jgi:hypothetical protein
VTQLTVVQAFADAMSALVEDHDIGDVLTRLVSDCAVLYPADAVAIMVTGRGGKLELLSATSHQARELELLQIQHDRGPCVDAVHRNESVFAAGLEDMTSRWGAVGAAIVSAGYESVHAFPMHWRGHAFGGLNIFAPDLPREDAPALGQMFADVATLVVVQSSDVRADQISARIHEAVLARGLIEQAKGVLAYEHDVDVSAAYDLLVDRARLDGVSLSETARRLVDGAHGDAPR